MELETAANPAPAAADTQTVDTTAPANAAPEAQTQAEGTTEASEQQQTTDAPDYSDLIGDLAAAPEEVEVEYDGAKYKVPAPLKDALLRQQDYTKKTMEIAEQRRELETRQRQVQEAQQLSAAEIKAFSQLDGLNAQLANFDGIDWLALDHADPEVIRAKGAYDELVRQRATLSANIQQHLTAKQAHAQQIAAKEREQVDQVMAREVKDWNPEKRAALEQFAVSQGIPAELARDAGAAEFKILHLANIGAQFIERQRNAARAAAAAASKPANEVGQGAGSGPSDPSLMSMDQYRAWRAAQG